MQVKYLQMKMFPFCFETKCKGLQVHFGIYYLDKIY